MCDTPSLEITARADDERGTHHFTTIPLPPPFRRPRCFIVSLPPTNDLTPNPLRRRSKARQIKSEKAGVPERQYVEPRRETPSDVQKRAQEFLNVLVTNAARAEYEVRRADAINGNGRGEEKNPRLALVVSHGGFLNVAMLAVMGLGDGIGFMSNCAVAIIDVFEKEGGGGVSYVPRELNDESHLFAAGLSVGRSVENFKK